jgi:HK97 gp10 family phage protein
MAVNIEMSGMDELLAKVEEMGLKVSKVEGIALRAAAEPVAADMRSLVKFSNINELHIKDDIQISNIKTEAGVKYVEVGPIKTAWRAKFLEFGTSKMTAKPFMSPAYERNKQNIQKIIQSSIEGALKE